MSNLWIRSQNKRSLLKVESVICLNQGYILVNDITMGNYKTEQRGLEVLNEIQKLISSDPLPFIVVEGANISPNTYDELNKAYKNGDLLGLVTEEAKLHVLSKSTIVYQMPEK